MVCSSTAKPTKSWSAESVGWSANRLTLGKLSGRNAFKTKLAEFGH